MFYFGDLFPTEPRKPPSCPRSYSVNRKGKPTHPSAHLVDWCGFPKRKVQFTRVEQSIALPPLLKVTCCIRHFFNSFPCCIPLLFLRYGKGPGMVGYEHSPGNLFGLTKKSYIPWVGRRFNQLTSFAIHAFMFLWPDIFSWFPFQIVLWTFYQYEAIVKRYTRLVIWVIKRSNHNAYLGGHYFIISFWLTSSCSFD